MAAETQKLKVFISWAGERANAIGSAFHDFLPDLVNAVQPFMSGKNIDKGTRWSEVLNSSLQESSCAIVCLTSESAQSPWVAFEAGAISRAAGSVEGARARIWTYLSGLEHKDLQLTPFAEYQATSATQEETYRLVQSINKLSPDPVSSETLKRRFEVMFWPDFTAILESANKMGVKHQSSSKPASDAVGEVLSEILSTVRSVQRDVQRFGVGPPEQVLAANTKKGDHLAKRLVQSGILPKEVCIFTTPDGIRIGVGEDTIGIPDRVAHAVLELNAEEFRDWVRQILMGRLPQIKAATLDSIANNDPGSLK